MKIQNRPLIFLVDFVILVILFSPVFIGRYQYAGATPPQNVKSLSDFREKMDPGNFEYFKFGRDDREFYEARHLLPFWFTIRSGPCCYVFDSEGKLIDWIADNGDDRDWDLKWGQTGRQPVDFDAIKLE